MLAMGCVRDEGLFWMDFYGLWLARILHGPVSSPCLCITTVFFTSMFYHLATIYQIVCNITNDRYIGSTCQPTLARRLAKHVNSYKQHLKGNGYNVTSYIIIERDDYNIYLIENFPCDTKDEQNKREGQVIKKMESEFNVVNRNIPGRTKKEWEANNADKIKEYMKLYRADNRDDINQKIKTILYRSS
jgi:hypothetical protein